MYILICESSGLLKILAFLKIIMNIVFILAPIGLILMVTIDFAKAVISGDEDKQRKTVELGFNRILYAALLFSVPYIVSLFMTIISTGSNYATCLSLADNPKAIAKLEEEEDKKKEAEKEAKAAALKVQAEKNKKMAAAKKQIESRPSTNKGEGCDGVVYYENGTFYKPSYNLVFPNGTEKTKGSAEYGYNKYFFEYLTKFVEAAKKAGHNINYSTTVDGAWRSYERQQYFYNCMINKNCNNGNTAADPGKSNHGWGIASDLQLPPRGTPARTAAVYWAKANAEKYGLCFPVPGEDWHIEPIDKQVSDEKVKPCI